MSDVACLECARLRARVAELEELLAGSDQSASEAWEENGGTVMEALVARALKGDVQAVKLWNELRRQERLEAATGARETIDDYVVPAGTVIDPDPKEA